MLARYVADGRSGGHDDGWATTVVTRRNSWNSPMANPAASSMARTQLSWTRWDAGIGCVAAMAFDALEYARRLRQAGVPAEGLSPASRPWSTSCSRLLRAGARWI
jgi:hypothetical protein